LHTIFFTDMSKRKKIVPTKTSDPPDHADPFCNPNSLYRSYLFPTPNRARTFSTSSQPNPVSKSKKSSTKAGSGSANSNNGNSNTQELSLMEQLEEAKKDFPQNFHKEVQYLKQKKKELEDEVYHLQEKLVTNREYIRPVLQKKEMLQQLQNKLNFLLSGKCKELWLQRINEFTEHHRLNPVLNSKEIIVKKEEPSNPPNENQEIDMDAMLRKKLGFDAPPKLSIKERSKLLLDETDPFFSHVNVNGDWGKRKKLDAILEMQDALRLKKCKPESNDDEVHFRKVEDHVIPPEYDIANLLYLPKNHSACIQAAALDVPAQPSSGSNSLAPGDKNALLNRYRLFCNCGIPMMDKGDIGKIFCIQCGLSREYQDTLPLFSEDAPVRPTTVHTKKNSQISAVLNPFRRNPFLGRLPETPFDCLRKERQTQIIRTRKTSNDEQVKNSIQKNGLAKTFYPYRNQITTHFTGLPPSQYLTPEKDAYWTSTLQKNPSLIANYRAYTKRPMLEKFQSGDANLNLLQYLEKMHPATEVSVSSPRSPSSTSFLEEEEVDSLDGIESVDDL